MSLDLNSATGMFLGLAIGDAMGSPIDFEIGESPTNSKSYFWKKLIP